MSSRQHKHSHKPTAASKHTSALHKKQEQRKIKSGVLPSPDLHINLDEYASFVNHLQSSTRILALLGAGLSAASGIPTFRGPGGFWRDHNAMDLATPEAFYNNPELVWQFYNCRRHMCLKAAPNKAHIGRCFWGVSKPTRKLSE